MSTKIPGRLWYMTRQEISTTLAPGQLSAEGQEMSPKIDESVETGALNSHCALKNKHILPRIFYQIFA